MTDLVLNPIQFLTLRCQHSNEALVRGREGGREGRSVHKQHFVVQGSCWADKGRGMVGWASPVLSPSRFLPFFYFRYCLGVCKGVGHHVSPCRLKNHVIGCIQGWAFGLKREFRLGISVLRKFGLCILETELVPEEPRTNSLVTWILGVSLWFQLNLTEQHCSTTLLSDCCSSVALFTPALKISALQIHLSVAIARRSPFFGSAVVEVAKLRMVGRGMRPKNRRVAAVLVRWKIGMRGGGWWLGVAATLPRKSMRSVVRQPAGALGV